MKRTCTALLALPALALGAFVPTSAAHADDYVFSGRIVTVFQGTPIAGVEVQATPPAGSPATVAVTDADGRWSFTTAEEELLSSSAARPTTRVVTPPAPGRSWFPWPSARSARACCPTCACSPRSSADGWPTARPARVSPADAI